VLEPGVHDRGGDLAPETGNRAICAQSPLHSCPPAPASSKEARGAVASIYNKPEPPVQGRQGVGKPINKEN
jgi:hypothetical protein